MRQLLVIGVALALTACASNPDKLEADYVPATRYKNYDCDQIGTAMDLVGERTGELYSELADKRKKDNWQMGVGLFLFWPALFFLERGDGPEAEEYARLKGEFEALRQASVQKSCGHESRPSPEEIIKRSEARDKKS